MLDELTSTLALATAGRATISARSIGDIVLDVVTDEDHQSELRITENPIESGAASTRKNRTSLRDPFPRG
ncbi:hypothetical protein AWB75_07178 [Caballeronia catudaia]|uniref:Dit-like phage tail protein N-terminal domain-containing protein n=1 Tax=Caballeronia catudaia TaxID=1777136 RepID=A0A158DUC5_9BURK|nr:hypothetical protein [Caballeronia catudaia]SAK98178.1 hypothetical protein AWB75_07178 [Caballeronia catudaia]